MSRQHCAILAHAVTPTTYRCPSPVSMTTFHWHAYDPKQPYFPMVRGRLCQHRHKTQDAANACVAKNA